jgi:hypothetical protein
VHNERKWLKNSRNGEEEEKEKDSILAMSFQLASTSGELVAEV